MRKHFVNVSKVLFLNRVISSYIDALREKLSLINKISIPATDNLYTCNNKWWSYVEQMFCYFQFVTLRNIFVLI